MANKDVRQITYEPERTIEPFYTGGDVAVSQDGQVLASCVGDDVVLTDLSSGQRLARIEGVGGFAESAQQ